jgi:hypothetical protein
LRVYLLRVRGTGTVRRQLERHGDGVDAVVFVVTLDADFELYRALLSLYFPRYVALGKTTTIGRVMELVWLLLHSLCKEREGSLSFFVTGRSRLAVA